MSTTTKKQVPIYEGLFTWPSDEPQLIGGQCKSCGVYSFPKWVAVHKPGCKQLHVEEILFSKQGKVVSYTVQHYQPPPPFRVDPPFEPYGIGLVEFPEGLRIPGIMTGCKIEDIKTGMTVKVVAEKLYTEDGTEYLTWKYLPV